MKRTINFLSLMLSGLMVIYFLSGCGGGGSASTNISLGKLPGIAKKYSDKIDKKKKDLDECTDMEKAFKLDKEIKSLKKESDEAISEYLLNNPIGDIPFEQKAEYPFTIERVFVNTEYESSSHYLQLKVKIKVNEDILNKYGGFEKTIFAYANPVDSEGTSLSKKSDVFSSGFGSQEFKKDMDFELMGGIQHLQNLENFDKLIFVSREEYDNPQ